MGKESWYSPTVQYSTVQYSTVQYSNVVVLAAEHVGAAGLPQEGVAGRHADGVPEVHHVDTAPLGWEDGDE